MAFGCMVGWGVFAMPGNTFLPVAGPFGTTIAMLIGMVIMLVIGNNFSYLMSRIPITGGVYSYAKQAFGRDHAFLSSWFLCLSYLTIVFLNGTALFFIIRTLFSDVVQNGFHYTIAGNEIYLGETVVSVLVLAGIGVLFVTAKPFLQRLHTILACILLIGIIIIAVVSIPRGITKDILFSFGTSGVNKGYAVFSIVFLAPWAYVGFEVTSFDTAHFKFSVQKTGKILVISIIIAALAYIAMAVVSVSAVPDGYASWQEYITALPDLKGVASVPTFYAAHHALGTFGLIVMTVTAVAAILTGIIGGYRATTRVLSTMAEDRILSEKFSKTTYSIVFIMVIAIILSLFGRNTLNWFVDLTSFGAIVGFGYTSLAAYKTAKAENQKKVMATGMIGTIISVGFVLVQLVPRLTAMDVMCSEAFLLLSLWCLLGFLFYWRTVIHSSLSEFSGISTSGIVLFCLLIYTSFMWFVTLSLRQDSVENVRKTMIWSGIILMLIIFTGLIVMLYVQNLVRKKHEQTEREKIRAVEGSLAKSQFLFNMSHDIRTPMNAIIGYTNLAMKEAESGPVHDYLEKIILSSQHLLNLINDILEMSRIESGKLELEFIPMDLCEMVEGIRDLFQEQMNQKKIDFQVHTSQIQHRYVWCDKKNLSRVLLNVLSNAYKFTPEGGKITASVLETGSTDDGVASYEIRILDTGIGMSKEFAEKMFNAFERERTSTASGIDGTGLGLSITKSIVDLMGGTIEVLTAPGSGTEMIFRLKFRLAEKKDIPADPEEESREKAVSFEGKHVLLVEDNQINMEIARMILENMGFIVDTAENGQIALDHVKEASAGDLDLILMDIQMPVMDGYEATKAIRSLDDEDKASIPIVAMTANAFMEDVRGAEEAGMQGHIAKPIDVNRMIQTLTDVLNP